MFSDVYIPADDCHDEGHRGKHVAHGAGIRWRSELQPRIIEVLINNGPEKTRRSDF